MSNTVFAAREHLPCGSSQFRLCLFDAWSSELETLLPEDRRTSGEPAENVVGLCYQASPGLSWILNHGQRSTAASSV